ncbi:MAG: hypothetical protein LUE65_02070 [Clostridiales bacterium]|nr:hypothetical protein [Clostridiales bacterium]
MGRPVSERPPNERKEGAGSRYLIGGAILALCGLVLAAVSLILLQTDGRSVTESSDLRMLGVAGCTLAAAGLLVIVLMIREQMEAKKKD